MALIEDPKFKVYVEKYAADQKLFHADFAAAFGKLIDLGVNRDGKTGIASVGGCPYAAAGGARPKAREARL